MIRFRCDCGRELQGRPEDAGRAAKCPACGALVTIPQGDTAPSEAVTALPQAPEGVQKGPRDDDYYPDDRDPDRRPRRREFRDSDGPQETSGKATAALIFGILSLCLPIIPAIVGLILGLRAMGEINKSRGRLRGHGLAMTGVILSSISFVLVVPAVLIGLLLPAVQKVRAAAARVQEQNSLKQMAIGMHSFHDANGGFPQAARGLPAGGPPVSWRVQLLPYIEQDNLFRMYRMNEAWDGPTNSQMQQVVVKVYHSAASTAPPTQTHFQVLVGPGTAFEDPATMKEAPFGRPRAPGLGLLMPGDFPDGTSNTILIATAGDSIPWSKPEDLPYAPGAPLPRFASYLSGGFNVSLADGSVRFIRADIHEQTLRAAITRNGGEVLGGDW